MNMEIFFFRKVEYNLLRGCVKLNGATVTKKSIEVSPSKWRIVQSQ